MKSLRVVWLADAPMRLVACTPWRFLSQIPDYSQHSEEQREYQHIVAPVFAITQPSPLYVEWDFLFRILLIFLTNLWVSLSGSIHLLGCPICPRAILKLMSSQPDM